MQKDMVLLKDITIPKGTKFTSVGGLNRTLVSDDWYECTIGLSTNTYGIVTYGISDDLDVLDAYFTELK